MPSRASKDEAMDKLCCGVYSPSDPRGKSYIFRGSTWRGTLAKNSKFKPPIKSSYISATTSKFWEKIRNAAATENMAQYLPQSYKAMNESVR